VGVKSEPGAASGAGGRVPFCCFGVDNEGIY
jgi:hypothetical protein